MAPPTDQDWLFLDTIISLADELAKYANQIKEASDDPAVLRTTMYLESNALLIWKQARDYRERLKLLKELAQGNDLIGREEIAAMADEISRRLNGRGTKKTQVYRLTDKPESIK